MIWVRSAGVNIDVFGMRRSRLRRYPELRELLRRSYLRRRGFAILLTPDKVLCRVLGRHKLYVSPHDQSISPHLMVDGYWEPRTTEVIVDLLRPGMVAIDVGANLGYFTLLMAALCGHRGRVLAFEPNPPIAAMLRASMHLNGLSHMVTVFDDPVGDTNGAEMTLYVPPGHPGGAQRTTVPPSGDDFVSCRTRRLDDVPGADEATLIKIDAEGMEESVWRGMTALIAGETLRHIVLEFTGAAYGDPSGLIDEIAAAGFVAYRIDDARGLVPTSRADILAGAIQQMLLFTRDPVT